MVTSVGLSRPLSSGLALKERTSLNEGEENGFETPEALVLSSFSSGLASANFQSPDSVSRTIFHELVATGKVTSTAFGRSTWKKSFFNHSDGFGSRLFRGSLINRASWLLPETMT